MELVIFWLPKIALILCAGVFVLVGWRALFGFRTEDTKRFASMPFNDETEHNSSTRRKNNGS